MKKFIFLMFLFSLTSVFAETFKCEVLDNAYNWDFPATEVIVEVDYQHDQANVLLFDEDKLITRYNECPLDEVEFGGRYESAICTQPDGRWAYFYKGPILFIMEESFGPRAQVECEQLN